jgi:hypothetical protein
MHTFMKTPFPTTMLNWLNANPGCCVLPSANQVKTISGITLTKTKTVLRADLVVAKYV